ncbi:Cysteine-rich secretory protein family protein [compost metagenome]
MINYKKSIHSIKRSCAAAALLLFAATAPLQTYSVSAASPSFTDTNGHWASSYITWAVDQQLAQGYGDGSFKPNKLVSEAEFLAMLLRTYSLVPASSSAGGVWSKPYYDYAANLGWPLARNDDSGTFRRGQAALLIASAVNGKAYTENEAIQWLLDEKLSNGRTSATVQGYEPDGKLTRAEALTFFYNLKPHTAALSTSKIITADNTLGGIAINDSVQKLKKLLGEPVRIDPNEWGFSWYVYNGSYSNYMMFGVQNDTVTALFSNSGSSWNLANGLKMGQTLTEAKKSISSAARASEDDDYYTYSLDNVQTTLFIDRHSSNKVIGLLKIKNSAVSAVKPAYSSSLQAGYEQQSFDLANAERALRGVSELEWDKLAAASARKHSTDMMSRDFFDHTNPDGKSPFDRMKKEGISYRTASENIAAGYANSIYAHYGWMNSTSGHREALLDASLKRLGTGVSFGGSYSVYYTQNFYTP